jgi:hypothetical protein
MSRLVDSYMSPTAPLETRLQFPAHWRKLEASLIALRMRPWKSELAVEELGRMLNFIADEKVK